MVVYGKRKTKYILSKIPVGGDTDGAIYPVSGREDILVKIYQSNMRTRETENRVIEAMNGVGVMLDANPIDLVYERGKFVGYVLEKEEEYEPLVEEIKPIEKPVKEKNLNPAVIMLLDIIFGLLLSYAVYFWFFPRLANRIETDKLMYYFSGVPMIVGGWIALIMTAKKVGADSFFDVLLGIIAFIVGCAVLFFLTGAIITVVTIAVSILWAILPTVIVVGIVVWILMKMMR